MAYYRIRPKLGYFLIWLLVIVLTACLCITIAPSHANFSSGATVSSLMQQGRVLYEAGKYEAAIALLKQAAQAYQAQGDGLRQAIALSNLALVYQQLGQWQEANQAIAQSLDLLKGNHSQSTNDKSSIAKDYSQVLAQALQIQGSLQLDKGQAEPAIANWQRAESIYKHLGDGNGIAQSQINQSQALRVLGYYRRALTMLLDLRKTLHNQPDSLTKVTQLRSLGNTLRLVGDLDQSREVLQQALELINRLPSSSDVTQEMSAVLFDLGNTARANQDISSAISFYQRSAELAPTELGKVQAQINQFSLVIENRKSSVAQLDLPELQSRLDKLPISQSSIYARVNLAQSLLKALSQVERTSKQNESKQNELKQNESNLRSQPFTSLLTHSAAELLATAIQQARQLEDRRAEAYALGNLGHVYEQTGQWQEAQTLTRQALNLAQGMNASDISYRWHWQLGRLFKQQGKLPEAIAAYDAAVNELRSLRGDLVAINREVQFSFRESVEPVYRESVELLLQLSGNQSNEQNLDKARQRIEALQLAELDNFFREACLDTRTVLLDKVVDQDNPTTAIIYPIILPHQLTVIVKFPRQPLHLHTIQISKVEVETLLQNLKQNLTEIDASDTVQTLSQQVYRWLIEPIQPNLKRQGVNTLVFVLDGALRSIPMAGLYDGEQYLVEKYAIAVSVGLQLFPPKSLTTEPLNVLAAGLVEPPPPFRQQFPPLPEIKSELALISQAGVSTQQLLNQSFTSRALEAKVNSTGFNVVHLATHGQFSSQARDTFILAADGPINVTQLDSLLRQRNQSQSKAIELLVLSACQTAEGDDRATLGLAGVAVKAGARSTLASLWQIDDRSTAILIGEFYRELATHKVTKAEALRRAQVALLEKYPNYSRPSYWAAYTLIGNWL